MMLSKQMTESQGLTRLRCAVVNRFGDDLPQEDVNKYCFYALTKATYIAGILSYEQNLAPDFACYGGNGNFETTAMTIAIQLVKMGLPFEDLIPLD